MPDILPTQPACVLPKGAVTDAGVQTLGHGAALVPTDLGSFAVSGPGAVTCLQGMITSDLESPTQTFSYGAALTAKGMIVTDFWTARTDDAVWITLPTSGMESLAGIFQKFLPPRLAKAADRSADQTVLRLAGPKALDSVRNAGLDLPAPGEILPLEDGSGFVAVPPEGAPFSVEIRINRDAAAALEDRIQEGGAVKTTQATLELARLLAGWPKHGAEIAQRTLPQEVRFDEHRGVSHSKGCYTGQETVARLHFRGHTNRRLHGIDWSGQPDLSSDDVTQDGLSVGRVTSVAWVPKVNRYLGLAIVHRKAETDRAVTASGAEATIQSLPFPITL